MSAIPNNTLHQTIDEETDCHNCSLKFKTWADFHEHKLNSKRHITCDRCSQDFKNQDALKRHHDLIHSAEQNLRCPGCGIHFARLGSLVGHIELSGCRAISPPKFASARTKLGEWHQNYQNQRHFQDYGRSAGDFADEPHPLMKVRPASILDEPLLQIVSTSDIPLDVPSTYDSSLGEDEDLMSFDAPKAILNSPWGVPSSLSQRMKDVLKTPPVPRPTENVPLLKKKSTFTNIMDEPVIIGRETGPSSILGANSTAKAWKAVAPVFGTTLLDSSAGEDVLASKQHAFQNETRGPKSSQPIIEDTWRQVSINHDGTRSKVLAIYGPDGSLDAKSANIQSLPRTPSSAGNAWISPKTFVPKRPAAISLPAPSSNLVRIDKEPADNFNPFDPDSPDFQISRFYIGVLRKYKCPYSGCRKTNPSPNSFLIHLKSTTHRNEKLQCHSCLRYFATATALTQHAESQGVRCHVRETNEYNGVVDYMSGGTATIAGRHVDNTIKYAVTCSTQKAAQMPGDIVVNHKQKLAEDTERRRTHWELNEPVW